MGAVELSEVLATLPRRNHPALTVGHDTFDDAAVYRIDDDLALVQTVDFFAPIVDDPFDFGRVAAANALSDVYAMGGEPITALAIAAFPSGTLDTSILGEILRGGEAVVHEAGALLVGGHTITDEEVKFGLAVTGRVDPLRVLTNAAASEGDILFLTKALGTGILATQARRGRLGDDDHAALVASMTTLNRDASRAALLSGVRCATDVTGFGLLGHALHIARASGVTLLIETDTLPRLPGTASAFADGAEAGGAERNARFVEPWADWSAGVSDSARAIALDPQTSGGLLLAVSPRRSDEFQSSFPGAIVIGLVRARGAHALLVA